MITREPITTMFLAYLNQSITRAQLVDWAESSFIAGGFQPEADVRRLIRMLSRSPRRFASLSCRAWACASM
jgi:hypothetical protein